MTSSQVVIHVTRAGTSRARFQRVRTMRRCWHNHVRDSSYVLPVVFCRVLLPLLEKHKTALIDIYKIEKRDAKPPAKLEPWAGGYAGFYLTVGSAIYSYVIMYCVGSTQFVWVVMFGAYVEGYKDSDIAYAHMIRFLTKKLILQHPPIIPRCILVTKVLFRTLTDGLKMMLLRKRLMTL